MSLLQVCKQQQTASGNKNLLVIFVPKLLYTTTYNNEIWYTGVLYQDIFIKTTITSLKVVIMLVPITSSRDVD